MYYYGFFSWLKQYASKVSVLCFAHLWGCFLKEPLFSNFKWFPKNYLSFPWAGTSWTIARWRGAGGNRRVFALPTVNSATGMAHITTWHQNPSWTRNTFPKSPPTPCHILCCGPDKDLWPVTRGKVQQHQSVVLVVPFLLIVNPYQVI